MYEINLANSHTWGSVIDSMPLDNVLPYFRELMDFYDKTQSPSLDKCLGYAFSALVKKLNNDRAWKQIKGLGLSEDRLENLTTLCFKSYATPDALSVDQNIMLELAGRAKLLQWSRYIYFEACKNGCADMVTHGIAIKIFGYNHDMELVEAAYRAALQNRLPDFRTSYIYGSMLQACYNSRHADRALEVFVEAERLGYSNYVSRTTMIKVAGLLKDDSLARQLVSLVQADASANTYSRLLSLSHYAASFPGKPLPDILMKQEERVQKKSSKGAGEQPTLNNHIQWPDMIRDSSTDEAILFFRKMYFLYFDCNTFRLILRHSMAKAFLSMLILLNKSQNSLILNNLELDDFQIKSLLNEIVLDHSSSRFIHELIKRLIQAAAINRNLSLVNYVIYKAQLLNLMDTPLSIDAILIFGKFFCLDRAKTVFTKACLSEDNPDRLKSLYFVMMQACLDCKAYAYAKSLYLSAQLDWRGGVNFNLMMLKVAGGLNDPDFANCLMQKIRETANPGILAKAIARYEEFFQKPALESLKQVDSVTQADSARFFQQFSRTFRWAPFTPALSDISQHYPRPKVKSTSHSSPRPVSLLQPHSGKPPGLFQRSGMALPVSSEAEQSVSSAPTLSLMHHHGDQNG